MTIKTNINKIVILTVYAFFLTACQHIKSDTVTSGICQVILSDQIRLFDVDISPILCEYLANSIKEYAGSPIINIEVRESDATKIKGDELDIPLNNCSNPVEVSVDHTLTYRVERRIELREQTDIGIKDVLIASLQLYYGFENKSIVEESSMLHLNVAPNSSIEYHIIWWHIAHQGNVILTHKDGTTEEHAFTVRTSATPEIASVSQNACSP